MNGAEFHGVHFRTTEQWASGVLVGLAPDASGALRFLPIPCVGPRLIGATDSSNLVDLAAGECRQLLWLAREDPERLQFYVFEPSIERASALHTLDAVGQDAHSRLLYRDRVLWLLDPLAERVLGLARDTLQILYEVDALTEPVDVAVTRNGSLAVLDAAGLWLVIRGRRRNLLRRKPPVEPLAVAIDTDCRTVLYTDGCRNGFGRIDVHDGVLTSVGDFDEDVKIGYRPDRIAIADQVVVAIRRGDSAVHLFDFDGTYLGATMLGDSQVKAIAVSPEGELFIATTEGIFTTTRATGSGRRGVFVTPTLDNGVDPNDLWHRADLDATLPPDTVLEARYAVLPDRSERLSAIQKVLKSEGPAPRRLRRLEALFDGMWSDPEVFLSSDESTCGLPDEPANNCTEGIRGFLLRGASGDEGGRDEHDDSSTRSFPRYAWIRLELRTLSPTPTPRLRRMTVWRPRLSFLRYLPAFYQDDEPGRRFLERYLSAFETVFQSVEGAIDGLPEYFAPDSAPPEFLPWLAGWLDLSLEESWSEEVVRRLLVEAVPLFGRRGTPWAATRLMEIVTGVRPQIEEIGRESLPLTLDIHGRLGVDGVLPTSAHEVGLRVGDPLGGRVLGLPAESFDASARRQAYRFMVILPLTLGEFERLERSIARVVRDTFPALSSVDLQVASESRLGFSAEIGTTLRLVGTRPLRLSKDATLGSASISRRREGLPVLTLETPSPAELFLEPLQGNRWRTRHERTRLRNL